MLIMTTTNNQNTALKKLTMNSETLKTSDNIEPPVQDPLVTQLGNCFEKFADALGQHLTTIDNQISKNVIDAMNTSDNSELTKRKRPKNALIPLGLRPAMRMKSTAGVSAKS